MCQKLGWMIGGMRVWLAVVAGLVVGGVTSPLQTVLPGAAGELANSGAPRLLVAVALVCVPKTAGRGAAALGFGVLAAEVSGTTWWRRCAGTRDRRRTSCSGWWRPW